MGYALKKPEGDPSSAWPAILVGLFASFGGILYGYDTGTISGIQTMTFWKQEFGEPTAGQISLIVSILSIGTFFGAILAGPLADTIGRKWGIFFSTLIPFNMGVIMQTAATEQKLFIAGRVFAGFGVGLISVQVPMLQSETLPKWIRGFIVGCYQLCITIGLLVASIVSNATKDRNDTGCYRIPLAVQFAWSIILCLGMLILPESPRLLIKKGKNEQALKSLSFLRRLPMDHPALVSEYDEIRLTHEYQQSLGTISYARCFKGSIGKRLFTGIALQSLQQLVGVNFIFYYGTAYFASRPNSGLPGAFILSVITNVVNTCSTFPGLYAVDRFGRRPLLLVGAVGMGVSQYIVAACGAATTEANRSAGMAEFVFICIYIFFFASTWGPGAWVVTGEIFPLNARAKCLGMTTAANWFWNWLLAFITPYFEGKQYANLSSNVFWIWGAFCWIASVFVYFFIYETKGLSLEQVSDLYEHVNSARKSKDYDPPERRFSVIGESGTKVQMEKVDEERIN